MDPLQAEYDKVLRYCDRKAMRAKNWHQRLWCIATVTTWVTLILCIIGLWKPDWLPVSAEGWKLFERLFLAYGVLTSSVIVAATTGTQWIFRRRWRNYRRCAEELCSHGILYRRRLEPYAGADPRDHFAKKIGKIQHNARSHEGERFLDRRRWWIWLDMIVLPPQLRKKLSYTPYLQDSLQAGANFAGEEKAIYEGRLENQQQWHLLKARKYLLAFIGFQSLIIVISLACGTWNYFVGRQLGLVAAVNAFILMLYAWRDFYDLSPLLLRYLCVANNLEEIRERYDQANAMATASTAAEQKNRLDELTLKTEEVLSQEYQFWYGR